MDSCSADAETGYAFVCDSEQISVAIADAANALLNRPTSTEDLQFYALGNDKLSAITKNTSV